MKIKPPHDCPGDVITYNCSIFSNAEELELTWRIILPHMSANSATLTKSARINSFFLAKSAIALAKATLTKFEKTNEYIESSLELYLLKDVPMNNTIIECRIHDLDVQNIEVILHTPGTLRYY